MDTGGVSIAFVWGTKAERESRANLIAAAPDLLEALTALTDAVDSEDIWSSALIDDARAAIAKARGQ